MFQPLLTTRAPNSGKVTVGATSTLVLPPSSGRIQLWLSNTSNEAISVNFGAAAVLNEGLVIQALSAVVTDVTLSTLGVYAICASGSKNLAYMEVLQ